MNKKELNQGGAGSKVFLVPIGIGPPLAGRPSLTTVHTDHVYGGSADQARQTSRGVYPVGFSRTPSPCW